MKLLFDENLSDRLVALLANIFPNSSHVKPLGLHQTSDTTIWNFAKDNGFIIVSKDSDFHQRSLLLGHPPKLIYLKVGNCPTARLHRILESHAEQIEAFSLDAPASLMIIS